MNDEQMIVLKLYSYESCEEIMTKEFDNSYDMYGWCNFHINSVVNQKSGTFTKTKANMYEALLEKSDEEFLNFNQENPRGMWIKTGTWSKEEYINE